MVKTHLIQSLHSALQRLGYTETSVQITTAKNPKFGDLSTNLAFSLSKQVGIKPIEVAIQIQSHLKPNPEIIREVTVTEPGFINFHINKIYYQKLPASILNAAGLILTLSDCFLSTRVNSLYNRT